MALPHISGEFLVISKEPDLKFLNDGTPVLTVAVASKSRKKVGDEWKDDKNFVSDVEFWREEAEQFAPLLTQFSLVTISGEMRVEEWEDKNGGGKRRKTVIQKATLGIRPPRPQQGQGGQQGYQQGNPQQGYQQAPQQGYAPAQGGYQQAPQPGYQQPPYGQPAPQQGPPMQGGYPAPVPAQGQPQYAPQPGQNEPPF